MTMGLTGTSIRIKRRHEPLGNANESSMLASEASFARRSTLGSNGHPAVSDTRLFLFEAMLLGHATFTPFRSRS